MRATRVLERAVPSSCPPSCINSRASFEHTLFGYAVLLRKCGPALDGSRILCMTGRTRPSCSSLLMRAKRQMWICEPQINAQLLRQFQITSHLCTYVVEHTNEQRAAMVSCWTAAMRADSSSFFICQLSALSRLAKFTDSSSTTCQGASCALPAR